uniref:Nudix hydrolase domain-containing protein n=1 Tax=Acrobeloides nanus TaxID=290746 RepID=A0A914CXA9_9BILA
MRKHILMDLPTFVHTKCRDTSKAYLRSKNIFRQFVPDELVKWEKPFPDYNPPDYTSENLRGKSWADSENLDEMRWNELDGKINRVSYITKYRIENKRPQNPFGRTGLQGRGTLGRWGPNHAADPIVSRFYNGKLQFIAIERGDTGGMVDPGEDVNETLKREFTEEALDGIDDKTLEELWKTGVELYRGYVDDHRNTDNAWMETVVVNFHDDKGILNEVKFKAGSDAKNVRWLTISPSECLKLYASHEHFIRLFAERHNVHL